MKKSLLFLIIVIIIVAIVIVIWRVSLKAPAINPGGPAIPGLATTTSTAPVNTALNSAINTVSVLSTNISKTLGTYLVATNGMTLYRYTKDKPNSGTSSCSGQCAYIWPPYTINSASGVGGIFHGTTKVIGTITRSDGAIQITYNGWPLYFYSKDSKPGDTNGQNIGGIWFVMNQ